MEIKIKTPVNSFLIYEFEPGEVFTNGTRYFMKTDNISFNAIDIQSGELLNFGDNKGPYPIVKGTFVSDGI